MTKSNQTRQQLENAILDVSRKVSVNSETGCFDEAVLMAFGEAWHHLASYFKDYSHNDTDIGVEVIHDYLEKINLFWAISKREDLSERCKERAEEALYELEASLDYIMQAVESRIYPNGFRE